MLDGKEDSLLGEERRAVKDRGSGLGAGLYRDRAHWRKVYLLLPAELRGGVSRWEVGNRFREMRHRRERGRGVGVGVTDSAMTRQFEGADDPKGR